MKNLWLCSCALLYATSSWAQTPSSTQPPAPAAPTVSLTGCVAGGSDSKPITLMNAMVLPTGSAAVTPDPVAAVAPPSASPSPDRLAVSAPATQPAVTNAATPASPTADSASTVGTIDTGSATVGVGTSGTIATPPSPTGGTPGAAGLPSATAAITGTAPAGSSSSTIGGYRLSGADMTSWIGRRVQITGLVVASASTARAATSAGASELAAPADMREFRVLSVQPVTGPCPKN